MWSGVEKVDSAGGGSQHRDAAPLRQLRALRLTLLVAVFAAAPLAAQQEQQRVVRGLSFEGNHAIDDYTLSSAIATTNSSAFATKWYLRWIPWLGEKRSFNELEFRRDVLRLLLLYRQSGYMNAVIDTLVRREGRDVYLKFRIYEGDPVRLTRLDMMGVEPREKLGDPYADILPHYDVGVAAGSEEHTSEIHSQSKILCRLLL